MYKWTLIIISLSVSFFANGANTSDNFSNLQLKRAQSAMDLEIAKTNLQKIKVEEQIQKLTGSAVSKSIPTTNQIALKEIRGFDNQRVAVLAVNDITRQYEVKDEIAPNLVIQSIFANSIKVLNINTQTITTYRLG